MIPKNWILSIAIVSILVLGTLTVFTSEKAGGVNGTTLYVGGIGPGNYSSIQSAIDDANPDDTVYVYNGIYIENLYVNKSINLIGESPKATIIDSGGEFADVILINSDSVTVQGFSLTNASFGTRIFSNDNTISNCIIHQNNLNGTQLYNSSNNVITNCDIYSHTYVGIGLGEGSNNNIITNCTLYHNGPPGAIYLWGQSNNNTIHNCTLINNTNGIFLLQAHNTTITQCNIILNHNGTELQESSHNTLLNCNIHSNTGDGIMMYGSNNTITSCNIDSNGIGPTGGNGGIGLYGINNIITNCYISSSEDYGITIGETSNNNIIYHNIFNNTQNAYDYTTNTWDNGYPSGGNYWNDYMGIDTDSDGIGDTPYTIPGDGNRDRYPLMHPPDETTTVQFQGLEPMYTTEGIEIAITINPLEQIAGVQFDMSFDPSYLSIEWIAEGNVFSEYDTYFNQGIIDNINGTLKNVLSVITTPGGSVMDEGSIAVVFIRAKNLEGDTPLNLSNVVAGKPDGSPLDVTVINASVSIQRHDRWDVNWDDQVNSLDIILIGQWWGETGPPCCVSADVNCDGAINILDMILVGQHWTG